MLIFKTATPVYTKLVVTGETESPIVIHKSVTIERVDLKTTHEEADHILVHQMVATAQGNQKGVQVVSDDTEVFVLLLHFLGKPKTSQYQLSWNLPSKRELS